MRSIKTLHKRFLATHHANGHATSHGFPIDDHIRHHAKILLCSAGGEAKATIHFVEDQRNVARTAHHAQLLQPLGSNTASLGGGALGWNACTGLTSTPAISLARRRMTASDAGWRSLSVRQSSILRSLPN